jgi:uncharacterized protein (TIRG00374 family)
MSDDDPANPRPSPSRQALVLAAKLAVSGGLLYVLLTRVDLAHLWNLTRTASIPWLLAALGLYLGMVLVSVWRWGLLLHAQHLDVGAGTLTSSFLVATFFNNFLPSNIGGDVIRIRDTSGPAGSKTVATTVVLVDRGLGLLGLVFVAAVGTTMAARTSATIGPVGPGLLWLSLAGAVAVAVPAVMMPEAVTRLLRPLRVLHQDWVEARLQSLAEALARFGAAPRSLVTCFLGAIAVQGILVAFYWAIAYGLGIDVPPAHLAIIVPITFIVQMLPVSLNGFGVREATFGFYFTRLGLPLESALALSFIGAALIMLFSVSGGVVYALRGSRRG